MQNTAFVLILSSRSISGGFSLVDCSPYLLMYICPSVMLPEFSRRFLISFFVRHGQVFRKVCFILLRGIDVVGLIIAACKYFTSSSLEVWAIMLFVTNSDCCVSRGTLHIPFFLFLLPLFF